MEASELKLSVWQRGLEHIPFVFAQLFGLTLLRSKHVNKFMPSPEMQSYVTVDLLRYTLKLLADTSHWFWSGSSNSYRNMWWDEHGCHTKTVADKKLQTIQDIHRCIQEVRGNILQHCCRCGQIIYRGKVSPRCAPLTTCGDADIWGIELALELSNNLLFEMLCITCNQCIEELFKTGSMSVSLALQYSVYFTKWVRGSPLM